MYFKNMFLLFDWKRKRASRHGKVKTTRTASTCYCMWVGFHVSSWTNHNWSPRWPSTFTFAWILLKFVFLFLISCCYCYYFLFHYTNIRFLYSSSLFCYTLTSCSFATIVSWSLSSCCCFYLFFVDKMFEKVSKP